MAHRRNIATAVLVAALVLGAASCGGDEDPGNDPGAQPTPTTSAPTSATPTQTPTESTSPTPDPEAWRADFTQDQLVAYDRALQVWKQYSELNAGFFLEPPQDLETVRKTYERLTFNAADRYDSYVDTVVDGGLRVATPPEPISYTGRTITLDPQGDHVVIVQCNDYTHADYRRNGEPIQSEVARGEDKTARQRVELASDGEGTWRILKIETVDRTCA